MRPGLRAADGGGYLLDVFVSHRRHAGSSALWPLRVRRAPTLWVRSACDACAVAAFRSAAARPTSPSASAAVGTKATVLAGESADPFSSAHIVPYGAHRVYGRSPGVRVKPDGVRRGSLRRSVKVEVPRETNRPTEWYLRGAVPYASVRGVRAGLQIAWPGKKVLP